MESQPPPSFSSHDNLFDEPPPPPYAPFNNNQPSSSRTLSYRFPQPVFLNIFSRLTKSDLIKCATVNKEFNHYSNYVIWRRPKFGGPRLTPISAFKKFLTILIVSPSVGHRIEEVNVSNVQPSLYDEVDESWLKIILQTCGNLKSLNLAQSPFFNSGSVYKLTVSKIKDAPIETLNLAKCVDISPKPLELFFVFVGRRLQHLNLTGCSGVSQSSLPKILHECPALKSINLTSNSYATTNQNLVLLTQQCKQLQSLNLTSCVEFTEAALCQALRYAPTLKTLILHNCIQLTDETIQNISTTVGHSLQSLDISNCTRITFSNPSISDTFSSRCTSLRELHIHYDATLSPSTSGIMYPPPSHSAQLSSASQRKPLQIPVEVLSQFKSLKKLIVLVTSETHIPARVVWKIGEAVISLNELTLEKKSWGSSAFVEDIVSDRMVSRFNDSYKSRPCKLKLIELAGLNEW
ncbi:hypothetical protein BKA69DRAFT_1057527 [Paraphysoderma sedebokerense]|nr:hypothetical protein BKA69DRAFT_1057527 [Paraphysoderma sedebokerense]